MPTNLMRADDAAAVDALSDFELAAEASKLLKAGEVALEHLCNDGIAVAFAHCANDERALAVVKLLDEVISREERHSDYP